MRSDETSIATKQSLIIRAYNYLRHLSNILKKLTKKTPYPSLEDREMQNIFIFKPDNLNHKHYQFQPRKTAPVPEFKFDTAIPPVVTPPPAVTKPKRDKNVKRMQSFGS